MELDPVFHALSDPTRRRLLEDLAERDGQTVFELHVRLTAGHGLGLTRQALSRHLVVLEDAGLIRHEWKWRSKHHFLMRAPLRMLSTIWLGPLLVEPDPPEKVDADCGDQHIG